MGDYLRLLTVSDRDIPLANLQRAASVGAVWSVDHPGMLGNYLAIGPETHVLQNVWATVERNPVGPNTLGAEEVAEFIDSLEAGGPPSAVRWLSDYLETVRAIYAIRIYPEAMADDARGPRRRLRHPHRPPRRRRRDRPVGRPGVHQRGRSPDLVRPGRQPARARPPPRSSTNRPASGSPSSSTSATPRNCRTLPPRRDPSRRPLTAPRISVATDRALPPSLKASTASSVETPSAGSSWPALAFPRWRLPAAGAAGR